MSSEGKSSEGGASAPTSKVDVKLQGKSVVRVYMLDNSTKTLILEPTTTAKVRLHSPRSGTERAY